MIKVSKKDGPIKLEINLPMLSQSYGKEELLELAMVLKNITIPIQVVVQCQSLLVLLLSLLLVLLFSACAKRNKLWELKKEDKRHFSIPKSRRTQPTKNLLSELHSR